MQVSESQHLYFGLNILLKPYSQIHLGSDESVGDAKKAQQQPGSEATATAAAAAVAAEAAVVASVPPPLSPPLQQPGCCLSRPHCEYLQLCRRFRQSLSLPSAYFSSPPATEGVVCHCAACHRLRGDPAYVKKGSPVRDSSTPVGWCRCGA